MIRYALSCENDHQFEAWFSGSAAFDEQCSSGHVSCPVCGSTAVDKALMTPSVSTARMKEMRADMVRPESAGRTDTTRTDDAPKSGSDVPVPVASNAAVPEDIMKAMRAIRDTVKKNADYVGSGFAEEARKIHYGESEERGIYGEASTEDVDGLKEEGIDVMPLPVLPEDRN